MHLDPLYSAETHFVNRLMSDFALRTLSPSRALLFFVPTWLVSVYSNTVYEKGVALYRHLVEKLSAGDPTFAAQWPANRSRHIFFLAGDKGACLWPRGPIYMSHWGLTVPWKAMMLPHLWAKDALVSARAAEPPCADGRDVILPPWVQGTGGGRAGARTHNHSHTAHGGRRHDATLLPPPHGGWQCELFFAGAITAEQKTARGSFCDDAQHGGVRCYSQGVRAAVFEHHANRSGFCLARRLPSELAHRSRFCLAPSGEGFGDRLAASMLAGCVPLIIQPAVLQPYEDVLPYERFAVRVGADAIPQLPALLAAITPTAHASLRAAVRRYAPAFDWGSEGGAAYEVARYSLCVRARADVASCDSLRPDVLRGAKEFDIVSFEMAPKKRSPAQLAAAGRGTATKKMKAHACVLNG